MYMKHIKNVITTVVLLPIYIPLVFLYCVSIMFIPDPYREYNTPDAINKRRQIANQLIEKNKTDYFMKPRLIHITGTEYVWSKPSTCISSSKFTSLLSSNSI